MQSAEPMKPPSWFKLALESRAAFEWATSALAWPWLLNRVKPGDGHPVLVLPGLVASDTSTWPLRKFLQLCGYTPYPWLLGFNVGPRDGILRGLNDRVHEIEDKHGERLSLVGWSLGGAMARALAVAMPERVRNVVTLGSPLTGHPKASNAWRVFELVSGFSADDPRLHEIRERQPEAPTTSIYSRNDGVVHWGMSMLPKLERTECIEVPASHLGMGVNPAVLWAIADRLAQPHGDWQPFDRNGWHGVFFRDPHREPVRRTVAPRRRRAT